MRISVPVLRCVSLLLAYRARPLLKPSPAALHYEATAYRGLPEGAGTRGFQKETP